MTSEREQSHAQAHQHQAVNHDDLAVGRVSRSAQLEAPTSPVVSGLLSRKADRDANGVAAGADAAVASASSSSGSSLPTAVMRKFESSLGTDLSSVRVHTGSESASAASAVGAKAYTMGQDIHFGAGQYDPSGGAGQHLLAHEVAHTVQQRGGTPTRQNKLEVSGPADAAEHEADHAADAMVRGAPTAVAGSGVMTARQAAIVPSTGDINGAGDEANQKAWQTALSVDTLTVQTDRSRVGEIVNDIKAQQKNVDAAVAADANIELKYGPQATNATTAAALSIFDDKLDVAGVDTAAFTSQFRWAYADYQRLVAEASEYTTLTNRTRGGDPLATVAGEHENASGLDLASSTEALRFTTARRNLNTAATKMDGQMKLVRGAANGLQGAIYAAKASAAAAAGAAAKTNLDALNKEIADTAAGVAKVVKICSAVGGLAGGTGATSALGTARASSEGGGATIAPSDFAKQVGFQDHHVITPEEQSKAALLGAMGKDTASVFGSGAGPDAAAEALVKAIGEYANKATISKLQAEITKTAAQEATFKAAGETLQMIGYQATLEGQAEGLMTLQQAFSSGKTELRDAEEALMAKLNKGGAKGKKQARAVLFLTDADRFLAQVKSAISAGNNQQANLKSAVEDRKNLRGTSAALGEKGTGAHNEEAANKFYYRCSKIVVPGTLYGTNTTYKLDRVFVQFQNNGTVSQGGKGTIEGSGSADDEVATKLQTLQTAQKQVTDLQQKVQTALGVGAPGMNA